MSRLTRALVLLVVLVGFAAACSPSVSQQGMRYGDRGENVASLQLALGLCADGVYGQETADRVKAFQEDRGLAADGIAGPDTIRALGVQIGDAEPVTSCGDPMPDVVGLNAEVAEDRLEGYGFTGGDIEFASADPNASVVLLPQNWLVTDQSIAAGSRTDPNAGTVVLTVVKLSSVAAAS